MNTILVKVFFKPGHPGVYESFKFSPDQQRNDGDEAIEWAIKQAVLKHPHATRVRVYRPVTEADITTHTSVEIEYVG